MPTISQIRALAARLDQAEESLFREQRILRTIVESIPGLAVFVIDPRRNCYYVAGEAVRRSGWVPADMIGRKLEEVIPPDYARLLLPLSDDALRGITREDTIKGENGILYHARSAPVLHEGNVESGIVLAMEQESPP